MITLDDFLSVMSRYLDGSLSPSAFIERFFALRAELVQTQELAIRQNPSVSDHLEELRRLHRAGAISSTDYLDVRRPSTSASQDCPCAPEAGPPRSSMTCLSWRTPAANPSTASRMRWP